MWKLARLPEKNETAGGLIVGAGLVPARNVVG